MKKYIVFMLCGLLTNAFCSVDCDLANYSSIKNSNKYVAKKARSFKKDIFDSIIVTLDSSVSEVNKDHSETIFKDFNKSTIRDLTYIYNESAIKFLDIDHFKQIFEIKVSEDNLMNVKEKIDNLKNIDGVYSVELTNEFSGDSTEPNDTYFESGNLWNLEDEGISADAAWDITTGSRNVRVGIIDTGISSHVDLNANVSTGYDFYNENYITNEELNNHGTHVAGTIGALGNNEIGITGINWQVEMVPLQTLNSAGLHSESDRIEAINFATNTWGTTNQISILNHSIGGYGERVGLREAIRNYPGLFVWSSGNENLDVDNYISTNGSFNLDNLIAVGSIDENNNRASTSNFSSSGSNVHIYAPGVGIYSTVFNDGYAFKSGTSMAAPHVTGTAALMLAEDPTLTGAELKEKIIDSSDSITINIGNATQVVNKLNAYEAVLSAHKNHSYGAPYLWSSLTQHRSTCRCGKTTLSGHFVSSDWNGVGTTKCLLCGGRASIGFVTNPTSVSMNTSTHKYGVKISKYFGEDSCLLENGLYVIGSEDMTALVSGTLSYPYLDR